MITTTRRITISLSHQDEKQLDELCKHFRETPTPAIKRCINHAYTKYEENIKKKDNK